MSPYLFRVWQIARPILFGIAWTFLLFLIPLLISLLIPDTNEQIFSLTNFVIVTSLAFYSQTLMERTVGHLGPNQPSFVVAADGTNVPTNSASAPKKLEYLEAATCFFGIVFVCVWFVALKGIQFELLDKTFTIVKNPYFWAAAVIMMPILGLIRALKHPGFSWGDGKPI